MKSQGHRSKRILSLLNKPEQDLDTGQDDESTNKNKMLDEDLGKENTSLEKHIETADKGTKIMPAEIITQRSSPSVSGLRDRGEDNIDSRNLVVDSRRSSSSSSSSSSSCSSSSSSSSTSSSNSSSKSKENQIAEKGILDDIIPSTEREVCNRPSDSPSILIAQENFEEIIPETRRPATNYYISPINSEESDADLSDDDPTFSNNPNTPRCQTNIMIDHNESSVTPTESTRSRSRKRRTDRIKWKQNNAKKKRNCGESYTSVSKSRKVIPAREMKPPCSDNCRLRCSDKMDNDKRLEHFKAFWAMGDLQLQRMFIRSCMTLVQPKYKYTNAANPRKPNNAFHFMIGNDKVRVCKTFFAHTLDITERMIRTVKDKTEDNNGYIEEDQRGRHNNHKSVNEELVKDIMMFIDTIPRIESHYLRASTSREYICSSKSVTDLYRDFEKQQKKNNKPSGLYHTFYEIFNTKFNLGFYKPKKDQCDFCLEFRNSTEDHKRNIQEKYDTHLEEKTLSRIEKRSARRNVNENNLCVCYDVQAVMQSPVGDTSSYYYKSKLNSYNFTITELNKLQGNTNDDHSTEDYKCYGDVHCYFWDESQGKRGAVEIGSCVLDYIKIVSNRAGDQEMNITFISDNCCGQNKNKYIASIYLYAVSIFSNIKSITHSYLIKGHTQNEANNVHSLIQTQIKKDLKSGPIYSPVQYLSAIKKARKTGKPFTVHTLTYDFFDDIKDLQEKWGYNFKVNDQRNTVIWNDIKVMKFSKEEPYSFQYKTSYKNDFQKINVRNRRKKMEEYTEIVIQKAYSEPFTLSENKKKDLKELITKKLIDPYYSNYYERMLN